ncbi:phosphatase PAP2 family protein [Candidatus Wolfebacteria bacterium]|nr:phosphatase PAP2 family protein [Candidatus Wolfebacteria bacterium]
MFLDLYLFNFFHSLVGRWWFLDWIFIFLAQYSVYVFIVWVIIIFFRIKRKKERFYFFFLASLTAILSRGIITEFFRFVYPRERPFEVLSISPLLNHETSGSFPSGHAAFFFALAFAVFFFDRELSIDSKSGKWLFWIALAMGAARVVVGVHWPLDILGGLIIAFLSALFIKKILPKNLESQASVTY